MDPIKEASIEQLLSPRIESLDKLTEQPTTSGVDPVVLPTGDVQGSGVFTNDDGTVSYSSVRDTIVHLDSGTDYALFQNTKVLVDTVAQYQKTEVGTT